MIQELDFASESPFEEEEETCPECGMEKEFWKTPGFKHSGETFCCRSCAEGIGCTCVEEEVPAKRAQGGSRAYRA